MLGQTIADPDGIEGTPGSADGLGLLDIETIISGDKSLAPVSGCAADGDVALTGYEMHMGRTDGPDTARPVCRLDYGRPDGATSPDGAVAGTYVHGLFAADGFRHQFLSALRGDHHSEFSYDTSIEQTLDGLADHLEESLDLDALLAAAGIK